MPFPILAARYKPRRPAAGRQGHARQVEQLDGKHWHGATATTAMMHIAIVEQFEGKTADWMEKVSDEPGLIKGRTRAKQS